MQIWTPEGDQVEIRYMLVTPDLAAGYLSDEVNRSNRGISGRLVGQYSRAMKSPTGWPFTGDSARFTGEYDRMLDGQHRMKAIVDSGKPRWMLMIIGLPDDVQRYIDAGRRRSAADHLRMAGVANASQVAAAARTSLLWEFWRKGAGSTVLGQAEVAEYALENEGVMERAVLIGTTARRNTRKGASVAAVAAAYVRAMEVTDDPFLVNAFFDPLATGDSVKPGSPMSALRSAFYNSDGPNVVQDLWRIIRAWNAVQRREVLRKVQLPSGGVSEGLMPDMAPPPDGEDTSELAEEAARAMEQLEEKGIRS